MPVKQVEEFTPQVCLQILLNGGLNHMIFILRLRFLFRLASLGSYFRISFWPLSGNYLIYYYVFVK